MLSWEAPVAAPLAFAAAACCWPARGGRASRAIRVSVWLLPGVEVLEAGCAGGLRLGRIGQGLKAAAGGSAGYAVHGLLLDEKP